MALFFVMVLGGLFFGFVLVVVGGALRLSAGTAEIGRGLLRAGAVLFGLAALTWAWVAVVL